MKHETELKSYKGTLEQLSQELGDLTYDSLALFLDALSKKINMDGDADFQRNRVQLSKYLHQASKDLENASKEIDKAWKICEPYM
ncbi:hypothetical protein [Flammeovirga sp. SubArs3]|uniref:hypothetical protein n=1 Tax=Flammeovirga sp. SubArs3 TaxID=2995316 RepID=UPI00248C5999|nr:hypothetical protein [Flammeovirga sp. SubArs3]